MTHHEPTVKSVHDLEEHSTWRKYLRSIRELELWEAPKSVIDDFRYQAARTSFLAYADVIKEGLEVRDFHEIIGAGFEDLANRRYQRLIVSAPPRSGKSMLACLFISWLLGRDGTSNHIIGSYGKGLSGKFYRDVMKFLRHPKFKLIFPEWKGFQAGSKSVFASGGSIITTSPGSELTGYSGGSASLLSPGIGASLIDDPLKSSKSKAKLDTVREWWGEELSTRRTNHYAQVLIGTRFHESDLHGILMETDGLYDPIENPMGWRWINIAAMIETPEQMKDDILCRKIGETHWPGNPIFSPEMLEAQKISMGASAYSALYMGTPTSASGQIVKAGWIRKIAKEDLPKKMDIVWFGIDSAFSENQTADESVICVAGISFLDPSKVYIIDLIKGRWGFPDLIANVNLLNSLYKPRFMCIEKAASGQSLIQVLKRETLIAVEEMRPIRSKTARLESVTPMMEAGRIHLVDAEWTDIFIKELLSFPFSPHDDSVDAFVWCLIHYLLKMDAKERTLSNGLHRKSRNLDIISQGSSFRAPLNRSQWSREDFNNPDQYNERPQNNSLFRSSARSRGVRGIYSLE